MTKHERHREIADWIWLTIATIILDIGVYVFKFLNCVKSPDLDISRRSYGYFNDSCQNRQSLTCDLQPDYQYGFAGNRLYFLRKEFRHQDGICECFKLSAS